MDNECKPPTMFFHSFLNQDQPREEKKKIMKTSATALEEKGPKKNDSSQNLDLVQELPEVNENRSEKQQPSGNVWAKLEKVPIDAPVWPDLPSPTPLTFLFLLQETTARSAHAATKTMTMRAR